MTSPTRSRLTQAVLRLFLLATTTLIATGLPDAICSGGSTTGCLIG